MNPKKISVFGLAVVLLQFGFFRHRPGHATPTVAIPVISPDSGSYASPQTITITDATGGATICYTTDGSTPSATAGTCTHGSTYSGSFSQSIPATVKAIGSKSGSANSSVTAATYMGFVAIPVISPASGTYISPQAVTITDATGGATICYTTDGSTPTASAGTCTHGTTYSGGFSQAVPATVQALGTLSGSANSAVTSAIYAAATVATPVISPPSGTYTSPQTVTITDATGGATICYTTDGSTPTATAGTCTHGSTYSTGFSQAIPATVQALGTLSGSTNSAVVSVTYVQSTVATPVISPATGTYASPQTITIIDGTAGATICYTTDGSTPTASAGSCTHGSMYSSGFSQAIPATVQALGTLAGHANSAIDTATYSTTTVATPSISPSGGAYLSPQTVTITDSTAGATICYTTDGSTPTASAGTCTHGSTYSSGFSQALPATIQALGTLSGSTNSAVASAVYTVIVATPAISPASGTYSSPQTITITDATAGATICFTTDGSTPTASAGACTHGTAYSGGFSLSSTALVQAVGSISGGTNSPVASASYTITAGGTVAAASCSQGDVLNALNLITASTTILTIPAGTCTWASNITFSVPAGSTSLSILGAGSLTTVGGGDQTVIIDGDTGDSNWLWETTTRNSSSYFRFAGITIQAGAGIEKQNGTLNWQGFSQNARLDHDHFNALTGTSSQNMTIRITNWIYGVADHNLMDGLTGIEIYLDEYGSGTANFGDNSWAAATNFGSGNAFFIENNTINGGPSSGGQYASYLGDCYQGGRQVIRYNTINNAGIDEHPTGGAERWRGCRSTEIYMNTMNGNSTTPTFTGFFDSSAPALMWGNAAPIGYESMIWLVSARDGYDYAQVAVPNGWGYCSATPISGIAGPSVWDQNSAGANGYACLDQAGRGQSDLLNGQDFPNALDTVTGTATWPHQALEPIYEWLDKWQPTSYAPGRTIVTLANPSVDSTTFVQNRDWYQYTLSWNGSAFIGTAFNGTVGTGSGLLSARPSTCTAGVAYWATDTNTLYKCTGNAWSTYYTPYTYPHPLDH